MKPNIERDVAQAWCLKLLPLAVFVIVAPFNATGAGLPEPENPGIGPDPEGVVPEADEAFALAALAVPTELALPVEYVVEEQVAVVSQIEDYGLFFIIPAIEQLAEEYGLDVILEDILHPEASMASISLGGVELATAEVMDGVAFFENVTVSDSLMYNYTLYDAQGTQLRAFVDVQTLVDRAWDLNGNPIPVSPGGIVGDVETQGTITYGVLNLFNIQPINVGDSVRNVLDVLPTDVPVTPQDGGTSEDPARAKAHARTEDPCRYGRGSNWMRRELTGIKYGTQAQPADWRLLAYGEWRVDFTYGHNCQQGNEETGHFGFGWGWSGNSLMGDYGNEEAFRWTVAAEGTRNYRDFRGTYYGHEIAVSGSQAFLYTPSGMPTTFEGNGEWGRSARTCQTFAPYVVAKEILSAIKAGGRSLDILGSAIPTKVCEQNWNVVSSSWSGSGNGVDSNIWATERGTGKQVNPQGELTLKFRSCKSSFKLKFEGASEHTAFTRASTASPWISERVWMVHQLQVPARNCAAN